MTEALKYLKENEEEAIKFIPKYDLNEIAKVMQKYTDQQFAIQRVNQQRELLKAFQDHYQSDKFDDERTFDWNIDNFLKAFNCG